MPNRFTDFIKGRNCPRTSVCRTYVVCMYVWRMYVGLSEYGYLHQNLNQYIEFVNLNDPEDHTDIYTSGCGAKLRVSNCVQ